MNSRGCKMGDPFVHFLITERGLSETTAELYRSTVEPLLRLVQRSPGRALIIDDVARILATYPLSRRVQFRSAYRKFTEFAAGRGVTLPILLDARKTRSREMHKLAPDLFELVRSIRIERIPRIRWTAYGKHTFDRYTPPAEREVVNDGSFEVYISRELGERLFKWATGAEWLRRGLDLHGVAWQGLPLVPRYTRAWEPMTKNEIHAIIAPLVREAARAYRP